MQTKKQKQEKTLKYWESELEKRLSKGWKSDQYCIYYVQGQINILRSKLGLKP